MMTVCRLLPLFVRPPLAMTTDVPEDRDVGALLRGLSKEDRDWVLCAVDDGSAAKPEHAALAVAVARWKLRRALVFGLPLHIALAAAMGFVGYLVAPSSAGFAFGFVLGLGGFVGYLWWAETWNRRRRALAANLALLQTGQQPVQLTDRRRENTWLLSFSLAWAFSMFVGGVLHFLLGAPAWTGTPLFLIAWALFRKLVRNTVQSIDEWGKR